MHISDVYGMPGLCNVCSAPAGLIGEGPYHKKIWYCWDHAPADVQAVRQAAYMALRIGTARRDAKRKAGVGDGTSC